MRLTVRLSMATVALAAALLSYQSLMHLGELAGYGWLSPLYPVVVDAGAAASCAAWLYTRGRQPLVMTWSLLLVSVVLNGTTHFLESTHTAPSWLLVVAVAAVPPTVLGLCVHLAVDMGRPDQLEGPSPLAEPPAPERRKGLLEATPAAETQTQDMHRPDRLMAHPGPVGSTTPAISQGQSSPTRARDAQTSERRSDQQRDQPLLDGPTTAGVFNGSASSAPTIEPETPSTDPVAELISSGAGRRKLAAELDISEHAARKLLEQRRNGSSDVGA